MINVASPTRATAPETLINLDLRPHLAKRLFALADPPSNSTEAQCARVHVRHLAQFLIQLVLWFPFSWSAKLLYRSVATMSC